MSKRYTSLVLTLLLLSLPATLLACGTPQPRTRIAATASAPDRETPPVTPVALLEPSATPVTPTLSTETLLTETPPAATAPTDASPDPTPSAPGPSPAPTGTAVSAYTPSPGPAGSATPTHAPTLNLRTVTIGACTTIWEPGYYKLTNDIKTTGYDCFYVQSHNVVLDCDNHTIEGSNYEGYAVFVRKWGFPLQQTATNIEIKNCRVSHHRTGIFVGGGNNVYIHNNLLSENLDTVDKQRFGIFLGMTEGGGVRLDSVKGGRVEYNVADTEAIGIDIRDSDHVVIRQNSTAGNSAWGISLLNTTDSQVTNNTTRNNIRYCAWGNGTVGRGCDAGGIILQDGSSRNVVSDNTVSGDNGNGIFIKAHASRCGDNNLIQNNKIIDAVYNAIEFSFCRGNRVIGNEISGSYDAVWFGFSANTEVRGNRISNMRNHGIISYNSHDSIIADNQIVNSREGIYFYWDKWDAKQFFFLTPTADNFASRDNALTNNTLRDNSVAAIHLSNSVQNRVSGNTYTNNGRDVWLEGKSSTTGSN